MAKKLEIVVYHCNICPYFLYINTKSKYHFTGCFCEKSKNQLLTVEQFEEQGVCEIPVWCELEEV